MTPPYLDETISWEEIRQRVILRVPKLQGAHGFRNWFNENESDGYLFDPTLIARSFRMYKDMTAIDRDHFMLIVGPEGSGKSTLAAQIACWVDPTFKPDNICFSLKEYVTALKNSKKGSCLILDEGGMDLYSRQTMSQGNIQFTKLFMIQRQKNISVIVCCPSFWDVDPYIRRHRINTMIRIISQGKYMGYLPRAVNIINELGYRKKPLTTIKFPTGSFWYGWFSKRLPKSLDRNKYLAKKAKHLDDFLRELTNSPLFGAKDRSPLGIQPNNQQKHSLDPIYNSPITAEAQGRNANQPK